jgi:YD repeat-containing protein
MRYPSPTVPGSSSTSDYVQPTYGDKVNVTALRLRDGSSLFFSYDDLDRLTFRNLQGAEPDVTYGYDLLGCPSTLDPIVQLPLGEAPYREMVEFMHARIAG